MRRSICVCEPSICYAGEVNSFRFIYTPASHLPKGAKLRFDFLTKGRPIDWQLPSIHSKDKKNMIWAQLPDGKSISPKLIETENIFNPLYEFVLPLEIKAGENFIIHVGSPLKGLEKGNRSQLNVQRRRPFHLLIDPKGKIEFKEQEVFHLDIRGNILKNVRIIAPSLVAKNKRFDVLARFEDEYGNLTNYAPEGSLIELSYENQRENLNWKLFIPETGFINLPNLYFNEPGVYKIQLHNLKTDEKYFSAPIKCLSETAVMIYWGLFHGESEKNDSLDNIESCLRQFRDEKAFQFYGVSPFENQEEISTEMWKHVSHQLAELNEEQRFCTFLGFQYPSENGLRQIIYFKDQKPIFRQKDIKSASLSKLYKALNAKEALSVPIIPMAKTIGTDFTQWDSEFEKIVEIYNAWGSSECSVKEGNLYPFKSGSKKGLQPLETGSILQALKKNCRFGFIAGGLDDRGIFADFYENKQAQYTPGLTAILATDHTKEALIQALNKRSCYATTGERIVMGFSIAGISMGGELDTKTKPGLVFNRHLAMYVCGTSVIREIAIIRNGDILHTFYPKDLFFESTYDDEQHLSKAILPSPASNSFFAFYYIRVLQDNGHMAWSSPIWIDYTELQGSGKKIKSK